MKNPISVITRKAYIFILIGGAGMAAEASAATISLGAAESFSILASSTITNTGATAITGDVGLSPGTSITGINSGNVTGTIHTNDTLAGQAQSDALAAYTILDAQAGGIDLTGQNLGGLVLIPGTYFFSSTAQLTGDLTLSGEGLFIFQVETALTTAANASIIGINGASAANTYFQVGSSVTLGTDTTFIGTIIAYDSITLNSGSSLNGRAFALNGAVTMANNTITIVPEAGSAMLAFAGFGLALIRRKR